MKVSIITSLQLFLAAAAVAAPLTADFSSTSEIANAERQDLNIPPAVKNFANTLAKRQDLFHAGGEASGEASGSLGVGGR